MAMLNPNGKYQLNWQTLAQFILGIVITGILIWTQGINSNLRALELQVNTLTQKEATAFRASNQMDESLKLINVELKTISQTLIRLELSSQKNEK